MVSFVYFFVTMATGGQALLTFNGTIKLPDLEKPLKYLLMVWWLLSTAKAIWFDSKFRIMAQYFIWFKISNLLAWHKLLFVLFTKSTDNLNVIERCIVCLCLFLLLFLWMKMWTFYLTPVNDTHNQYITMGDFTFWLSLLLSHFAEWNQSWTLKSRLRPEFNLNWV